MCYIAIWLYMYWVIRSRMLECFYYYLVVLLSFDFVLFMMSWVLPSFHAYLVHFASICVW